MKIGVITVHDSSNYGSFLQAYALQTVLQSMGHEVYFIRTRDKSYIKKLFINRASLKPLFPNPVKMTTKLIKDYRYFWAFKKEWKLFRTIDTAQEVKLDRIILGSDEIWNVTNKVFRKPIFYGTGLENVGTYAVSISRAKKEDFDAYPEIKEAIKRIDNILVRDENTKEVIDSITGRDTQMVADPTFLCDVSIYENRKSVYKPIKEKYLLVYGYEINNTLKDNIIRFARENNLITVSACINHGWTDKYVSGSPLAFCSLLRDADYVVTTTFHGTVFSVLNHKKFVSEPFTPKVVDVLEKVGLSEALIEVGADYSSFTKKLVQKHDYEKVEKRILEWRERSLKLLSDQLG